MCEWNFCMFKQGKVVEPIYAIKDSKLIFKNSFINHGETAQFSCTLLLSYLQYCKFLQIPFTVGWNTIIFGKFWVSVDDFPPNYTVQTIGPVSCYNYYLYYTSTNVCRRLRRFPFIKVFFSNQAFDQISFGCWDISVLLRYFPLYLNRFNYWHNQTNI